MDAKKKHTLWVRLLTAAAVLPLLLVLIWHPALRVGFTLFVAFLTGVGLYEFYAIVRKRGFSPETIGGILSGTLITVSGHFDSVAFTSFMLYGGCLLVSALHLVRGQRSIAGLSSTVFGIFYVGWFGGHLTLLRSLPEHGAGLVTMLIVAVVLTDSAAYFIGSRFGRHKVAPSVSPNKSWEGAVAGLIFALLGMWGVFLLREEVGWTAVPDWGIVRYLLVGALLSLVAQVGDFVESALKRDAAIKDSGVLFPGHGGVLDRCDGFLYAAPVLYYIAIL